MGQTDDPRGHRADLLVFAARLRLSRLSRRHERE